MTDEGQLGFDSLVVEGIEPKKPARKRRPATPKASAPLVVPEEAPAIEAEATLAEDVSSTDVFAEPVRLQQTDEVDPKPEPEAEPAPAEVSDPVDGALAPVESIVVDSEEEPADPAPLIESVEAAPGRLLFLTNRMNLNGLLSSRVLSPRESIHKYYADLLELSPGWVPILTVLPPTSLFERVTGERGAGAPVIVELAATALDGQAPDGPIVYLRAARLSDVAAIHFRDERTLREHRARGYSNVHPHGDLLRVSPELFEPSASTEVSIAPPAEASAVDWLSIDRVRGALNAALAASESGEALAIAAGLLGAKPLPVGTNIPPWLNWVGLTSDPPAPDSESDAEMADRLLFQTAYRILGLRDQTESWSPSEVLQEMTVDIAARQLNEGVQAIVDVNLQRVREISNIERDFEPFRNPGSPYVAAKSLLMVLLRPDLEQLLAWPNEETGADETTRVVAALLAGRLRGIARESVNLRSIALDDLTAAWAVRAARGEHQTSLGKAAFMADDAHTAVLLDGVELRRASALVPDPVPIYEALGTGKRQQARVAVSRRLAWPVQVRIQVPTGSDVRTSEALITITSSDSVMVETFVDEQAFIDRLVTTSGPARRAAVELLTD